MPAQTKRATIYFDPDLHKALRLKAVETNQSLSELVNDAVQEALARGPLVTSRPGSRVVGHRAHIWLSHEPNW
jgi:hypothetical protein